MDIEEYTAQQGMFLKAKDIIDHPAVNFVVTEEGEMVKSERFGNERLHLKGNFGNDERVFDCSKTNARFISGKLGTDTSKWVGAKLVLETYRTKTSDGNMTDAINVKDAIAP